MNKSRSTEKLLNDSMMSGSSGGVADAGGDSLGEGDGEIPIAPSEMVQDNLNYDYEQLVPNFLVGAAISSEAKSRRPISMYEPWHDGAGGYSSLPQDLVESGCKKRLFEIDIETKKVAWEAEDASEFIETLDESAILDIESFENLQQIYAQPEPAGSQRMIIAADIHGGGCGGGDDKGGYEEIAIYATITKKKDRYPKSQDAMSARMITSGPTVEKLPKIMTTSCYGELNTFCNDQIANAIVGSNDNLLDRPSHSKSMSTLYHQDNRMITPEYYTIHNPSITDGYSSLNSSIYEQTSSMNSSIEIARLPSQDRNRVRWWDDFTEETEAELQDIANKGELNTTLLYFYLAL